MYIIILRLSYTTNGSSFVHPKTKTSLLRIFYTITTLYPGRVHMCELSKSHGGRISSDLSLLLNVQQKSIKWTIIMKFYTFVRMLSWPPFVLYCIFNSFYLQRNGYRMPTHKTRVISGVFRVMFEFSDVSFELILRIVLTFVKLSSHESSPQR